MSRSLPSQRNLEDVKKEARELLHELRRWDATALRRHSSLDCEGGRFHARLADAQYIIAREYGYRELAESETTLGNQSPRHIVQRLYRCSR